MEPTTPTTPATTPETPTTPTTTAQPVQSPPAKSGEGHITLGLLIVAAICCVLLGYNAWTVQKENQKLSLQNVIYHAEHRILKDELYQKERALADRPTYEQGYKDALVRVGGPQTPGAYQDGWDDAMKVYADKGYADGYHAAIQQFGYTKTTGLARWLVPESKTEDKGGTPAKVEKK